ncbi:hypothetical protein G3I32_23825 [Streptomyces coelicoflavus]|uniref:Nuclear transport factor 2 family protein n=1 Tax=Streptomyces coelicoflavus TaxID=285562 RepID=A0A7K3PPH9_9ACTN|nr:hypothetical protein [Streptomyces coelicoflavus]NEB11833.1 hypothetical protein [Streptomyces coelicoflavus]
MHGPAVPENQPRLCRALERRAELERRAVEAVVRAFSDGEPTDTEPSEAYGDLRLDTVEADGDGVILHLTDSCGRHFLDGYWPAVRFDDAHDVVRVTVEA